MKQIFTLLLLLATITMFAQDKKAKKILDRVSEVYNAYQSVEVKIDMTILQPDGDGRVYYVTIVQKGEKFVFSHPDQTMYCDGTDLWVYIPNQNEVQINDYEIEEDSDLMISPKDLLKQYKSGKYEYRLLDKTKTSTKIEFKPLDLDSEYSKYKITLDTNLNQIRSVMAYAKDGSHVSLEITDLIPNKEYTDDYFNFDIKKYPDVFVEDLRL